MVDAVLDKPTGAENVVWDLSVFYQSADDPALQRDMDALNARADAFAQTYRGRVAQLDPEEMFEAIQEREAMSELQTRIGSFAFLNFYVDSMNPAFGALVAKVQEWGAEQAQKMLFFDLEWKATPPEQAQKLLSHPTLAKYAHLLEYELVYRPYTLSELEEAVLVEKSVTGRSAWYRFFGQLMSQLRFDYEGESITQSQVLTKLYHPDREVRRKAAESVTAGLRSRLMEFTFIFNVMTLDKAQEDKRRGYESWITDRNLANKAPDSVVNALIDAVTGSYELVARHYRLKRTLLGLDELFDYDRYAPLPLADDSDSYTWEQAREIVLTAYHRFSPQAGEIAARFFDEQWIHAALSPNKRGGAFASAGTPETHPFVFLNYTGKARDVSTLAHELGHGLHQYLAGREKGIMYQSTPLTTAETASVFGEMLTFNSLMEQETNPAARLAMLTSKIEDSFATVFRQISMNRFEDGLHTARRAEGELNADRISAIWLETQRAMFKDSVTLRDDYGIWWTYVQHFLGTPGYVYAYAFGELLVLALFQLYRERGDSFVPQYLDLLAAGDSDYPDRLLAKVGIDLNDPAFWNGGLKLLEEMIAQEEALAREVFPDKF
ncbi:MAG: M3 family oligoendopeptidase [bacterium]|nr:M3 family oligoendopeptidase [bacterium]